MSIKSLNSYICCLKIIMFAKANNSIRSWVTSYTTYFILYLRLWNSHLLLKLLLLYYCWIKNIINYYNNTNKLTQNCIPIYDNNTNIVHRSTWTLHVSFSKMLLTNCQPSCLPIDDKLISLFKCKMKFR